MSDCYDPNNCRQPESNITSVGTIAGIVVGCFVGVAILAVIAGYYGRKRYRRRLQEEADAEIESEAARPRRAANRPARVQPVLPAGAIPLKSGGYTFAAPPAERHDLGPQKGTHVSGYDGATAAGLHQQSHHAGTKLASDGYEV